MNKFLQNIFIFFTILINLCSSIIVIPFKTYNQNEPDQFTSPSDIFKYWSKNIIYSENLIGTPPQNIKIIINSQSFSSSIFNHMCDLPSSSYVKEKSNSYQYEKYIRSYVTMSNASLISETLYLYDNLDMNKLVPYNNIKFIYSQNTEEDQGKTHEYHPYTCINMGFQLGWTYLNDYQANFIAQLKKILNITETYDFTFEYLNNTDGRIIIGNEPHFYNKKKYSEKQYRISGAVDNDGRNQRDFYINFDNIDLYYKLNGNYINETISMVKSIKIIIDMGLAYGPREYKNNIDKIFFNDMKKAGKCKEGETKDNLYFYYCDKALAENDIKNNFPILYFEMKQFHKTFELTYQDLFRIKNDKIFFLVYFRTYSIGNYFEIGKIFLQKYTFTFNQETKMVGYYNFDLPGDVNQNGEEEEKKKSIFQNAYIWLIIIGVVVVFAILGFFIGKFFYDKARKKRLNEVQDDNYEYSSHQKEEDNKLCDSINE